MVTLRPMSATTWEQWRIATIREYAIDKVRVGAWPAEGAESRATLEFARLLPDGRATSGHDFRSIVNEEGEVVGAVWLGPTDEIGLGAMFIWDIVVAAAFRGRGYGRAALSLIEPIARELGYDAIRLHVFGDNDVARNLYRSAGYVETDVSMLKQLR